MVIATPPQTDKLIPTTGYYIRKRLPDGRLGYKHIEVAKKKYRLKSIPHGYIVNHISGNKSDDRPDNLEIIPHRENIWLNHHFFDNKQTRASRRKGTYWGPKPY